MSQTAPMLVPGTEQIVQVPVEDLPTAESEGYVAPSEEQVASYDTKKAYRENTSRLEREAVGAGVGATTQLLGVPALVANFTGLDEGATGSSWLASFASQMGDMDPAEAEEALREVAKAGPSGHFAGQVTGSLIGTKGAGAAGTAAAGRLGIETTGRAALAATTAESVAQHITLASENAFVNNKELSTDQLLAASVMGAVGPLALGPGLSAIGRGTRKGLDKIDAHRLAKFEAAQGGRVGADVAPPAKLADLFSSSRSARLQALSGVAEEGAGKLGSLAKVANNRVAWRVAGGVESALKGSSMKGALLGALSFQNLVGAAIGGVAGAAVRRFGARASGQILEKVAGRVRALSAEAAIAATKGGAKGVTPLNLLSRVGTASGAAYRTRLSEMLDQSRETLKAAGSSPEVFAESLGNAYGDLDSPMVQSMTLAHVRAMSYLQKQMPPQPHINPGMPQLGRVDVPLSKMESYARKLEGVMDPMSVVRGLAAGDLHEDTVEAVRSVYPTMFLDIEAQAREVLTQQKEELTRDQARTFETLFSNKGLVYPAASPAFQSRLAVAYEQRRGGEQGQGQGQAPAKKPGRPTGSPTLGQSMRTSSQRVEQEFGN